MLNKRLKAQDKTFSGRVHGPGRRPYHGPAFRVAGADASAFMEDLILSMGLGGAYTIDTGEGRRTATVGVRVERADTTTSSSSTPRTISRGAWPAEALAADGSVRKPPGCACPAGACPTPTPAPTPDISTPEGYLLSLLPATVGGEQLTSPWSTRARRR